MSNVKKIRDWYEDLRPETLDKIDVLYGEDVYFKDPFNEVTGLLKVKSIFNHMFIALENPKFIFVDLFENGDNAFVTWDFVFKIKNNEYKIHGSSHLKFNSEGKIIYHRDYWDVGEELLMKIPVVSYLYSILRAKLASP